jgi:hypothetical protein
LVRVSTRIGYFVARVWKTEGIHPGVVACSHHTGRWKLHPHVGGQQQASSLVEIQRQGSTFLFRQKEPVEPFTNSDSDTERIWWTETGVHQNLTLPVQPDPISGMHCWHQKVTVGPAQADDRYGDVYVDTKKSAEVFQEWLALTKPAPGRADCAGRNGCIVRCVRRRICTSSDERPPLRSRGSTTPLSA